MDQFGKNLKDFLSLSVFIVIVPKAVRVFQSMNFFVTTQIIQY